MGEFFSNNLAIIILIAVIAIFYFWYVGLISKKNKVKEALSGIDVQIKKRSDLIPNILKIAKKIMEHEQNLMEKVTALRTKANESYDKNDSTAVKDHIEVVRNLDGAMGGLMIQLENYPDLKSDQSMLQAQKTYNEVEEQIAASRRFYNAAVTTLNNSCEIFPGNIIARIAKVKSMPFYETDEAYL